MTGSDFRDYIVRTFKRTDKDTEIYEAMTDVVMDIKIALKAEDFKTESITLTIPVSGNYTVAVPADFGHMIGVLTLVNPAGGSWPLIKRSKEIYDDIYPYQHETVSIKGAPKDFCLYGNTFYIGPKPDLTTYKYQLNYTTETATAMVAGTTSVPFTARYRQYVKDMILARLYFDLDDDEKASKYTQLGQVGLGKIIANEMYNTDAPAVTRYQGV